MNKIIAYTDGSSSSKSNEQGGIGSVILYNDKTIIIQKSFKNTSNNRMELIAVIETLLYLKKKKEFNSHIEIHSDSQYVVHAFTKKWLKHWKDIDFIDVKNSDLWKTLDNLVNLFNKIDFIWVKGHDNDILNNICDHLATTAKVYSINLKESDTY